MQIKFKPSKLGGIINIPPSKSMSHRSILCAALATGQSRIDNIMLSKDVQVTLDAVRELGADYKVIESTVFITGIKTVPEYAKIDCYESGSSLRFLIPIACALGVHAEFIGQGKLPERPITPYLSELGKNGVVFDYNNTMPFSVDGQLHNGEFIIDGNISSQFVTGLLMALPIISGDSNITIRGKLESKPYVNMTIAVLKQFGIEIKETEHGYFIKGSQQYKPLELSVEGDYSQAAFFAVACASKGDIELNGLSHDSHQGDKEILEILSHCGARVTQTLQGYLIESGNNLKPFEVDVSDIPDLVPILAVLASLCDGKSVITGAARLKIKESDRLQAISQCLNSLGGKLIPYDDYLEIFGVKAFKGGKVNSFNDHRIAMSSAIAALYSDDEVVLENGECVNKSYPDFYKDYNSLGGKAHVISMEQID